MVDERTRNCIDLFQKLYMKFTCVLHNAFQTGYIRYHLNIDTQNYSNQSIECTLHILAQRQIRRISKSPEIAMQDINIQYNE